MRIPRTVFAACLVSLAGAEPAHTDDAAPIRLAVNDWAGQRISTTIMGEVLSSAGFQVAYVETPYRGELEQLAAGTIDVAMEIWSTTLREPFEAAVAAGHVADLGESGMTAREGWWYPAYMEARCPGLPDWRALNTCAAEFATDTSTPRGFYLGGPADWGGFDEERIAALGLNFVMAHAASDTDLNDALAGAVAAEAPIILWVYAPHWTATRFDGSFVAFPPYEPACYTDASWGVNPNRKYDCAKPSGPIWKAASPMFVAASPDAAAIVGNFTITNEEMAALDAAVEIDGRTTHDVVSEWMAENESRWRAWLP